MVMARRSPEELSKQLTVSDDCVVKTMPWRNTIEKMEKQEYGEKF